MISIINFFLTKTKLTYFILLFTTLSGFYFANKLTKEMFPPINLPKVIISGGYGTASINSLDSLVVDKLEESIKNIIGVKKIESFIQSGSFNTLITLKQGVDKDKVLNETKDVIQLQKRNYPSNMNEPSVRHFDFNFPLMQIGLSSNAKDISSLKEIAKDFKKKALEIKNVAGASIYDDSEHFYKFIFDYRKIEAFGINKQSLVSSIKSLSYIAPIGSIENSTESFFISTQNGKDNIQDILNTLIKVGNKYVYIKDIADVKYEYKDSSILTFSNQKPSVNISISRDKVGNSIDMQESIVALMDEWSKKYPDVAFHKFSDTTVFLINRLNVVISSLLFGIILVGALVWWMVNARTAMLVSIGIPFAFLLGIMFLYFVGYSINMMTLLGSLIILGVIVDDAIIVGENIQRHMNMTEDKTLAIKNAVSEVLAPVLVASFTTVFSFLPLLMISGEMGEFMKMIPVAIIVLLIGSVVESFIFLPLHSKHILKTNAKELDWSKALDMYSNFLRKILKHKKKFLLGFYILIPVATVFLFSILKYTLFPQFDGNSVHVRGSFDINYTIEDTLEGVSKISEVIEQSRQELYIKNLSAKAGFRLNNQGNSEIKPNVFEITLELHNPKPDNVFEKYVTPLMSIYGHEGNKIRDIDSHKAIEVLKTKLKPIEKEIKTTELSVTTDGPGIVKHAIEIEFYGKDKEQVIQALTTIKDKISKMKGVTQSGDNLQKGSLDLKLIINRYGESLGINETYLANSLNAFFSNGEFSQSLSSSGITSIISKDKNKDSFSTLKSFSIPIPNTDKIISLQDIVNFVYVSNYKEVYKVANEQVIYLFADIDATKNTAKEVLDAIRLDLDEYKSKNIYVKIRGESEQNDQLKSEMSAAFALSIFLIFAVLLIMFNSYKYAFIVLSIIPLSIIGALFGHFIMDQKMSMPSFIGIVGLAGVVINDGIVMLAFLRKCTDVEDLIQKAKLRLRPVLITSITTFFGLSVLIFFASGQAKILQPIAISLGYGMAWGTILTLIYVPILAAILNKFDNTSNISKENNTIIMFFKRKFSGKKDLKRNLSSEKIFQSGG